MKIVQNKFLIAIAAAALTSASANAQLKVGGVGSSAMFQTATIEAFQLANAAPAGTPCTHSGGAGYYAGKNAGQINDTRSASILAQKGNLTVVWDNATAPSCVYYYLSVDSGVGNRAFFATPRAQLALVTPLVAPDNTVISPAFFGGANPVAIPAAVAAIINPSTFTAAFTDIRPEDALFAENRTNCVASPSTLGCLGYGVAGSPASTPIMSGAPGSTASAQAVSFNIFGNDPITGKPVPAWATIPIGVSPVIFIANRTNPNGLGQVVSGTPTFGGMTFQGSPTLLFGGFNCDTSAFGINGAPLVAVDPILREPISGTMNTFEFNIMVPFWAPDPPYYVSENYFLFSQEGILTAPYVMPSVSGTPPVVHLNNWGAIQAATNNPLNGACPANGVNNGWAGGPQGARIRAIGTGEEVSTVKAIQDSIGYIFFSYGNVSSIKANPLYGYLTYGEWGGGPSGALIPTDPINPSGTYGTPYTSPSGNIVYNGNGQLPTCTAPCPLPPNVSFPNVRSGAYLQWSLLRAAGSPGDVNLQTLASGIADQVNLTAPDFVPFNPTTNGDNGLQFYRSHFSPTGINYNGPPNTPNNGINPANGQYVPGTEAGGDVGGCVDWRYPPNGPTNLLNCRY
jgi:hypothetical protein